MPRSHFHPISIGKRLAITYVIVCAFMFAAQRHVLFMPLVGIKSPAEYGLKDFTAIPLRTADGVNIQAWYHPARKNYPTLLYFHGNGGNLSTRRNYFTLLSDAGFGILAVDYRGYGASEGNPSEQGFYADARATMAYAAVTLHIPKERTILYGESIGTGVAVEMAATNPSAALVLQSPYTSVDALAARNYPYLPTSLLLKDHFNSIEKIDRISVPVLVFHGEEDHVVPITQGRALFDKANAPKKALYLPAIGHGNFDLALLTHTLEEFCIEQKIIHQQ